MVYDLQPLCVCVCVHSFRMIRLASCTALLFVLRLLVGLPWYQVIPAILILYLGSGGWSFLQIFAKTVGRDLQ